MGSIKEKAMFSFRMLDTINKGYITEDDVRMMMNSIFELWNIMTNSKVILLPEYVRKVYRVLDRDGDGTIDMQEYLQLYTREKLVFGWFEYLNQDEIFVRDVLNKQNHGDTANPALSSKIGDIKNEIGECMKILTDLENKSANNSRSPSPTPSPTRSRSNTPNKLTLSNSASPIRSNSGLKSKTLSSLVPNNRDIKGPFIAEIVSVDHPLGDFLTDEPYEDDELESDMTKSLDFTQEGTSDAEIEIFNLKKKVTTLGKHVRTLEDISPNQPVTNDDDSPRSAMNKQNTNVDQRGTAKRNLGLLFGHENWNLMMNLMIGFRAGVKG